MKIVLDTNPPSLFHLSKLSRIHDGVVPPIRLMQGFSMCSVPLNFVSLTKTSSQSHSLVSALSMYLFVGSRKVESSLALIVMAEVLCCSASRKLSALKLSSD